MLRRNLTRIELKLDDIEEYETIKKERELEKKTAGFNTPGPEIANPDDSANAGKTKKDIIHERIGYDPQPLPQPSRLPIH